MILSRPLFGYDIQPKTFVDDIIVHEFDSRNRNFLKKTHRNDVKYEIIDCFDKTLIVGLTKLKK